MDSTVGFEEAPNPNNGIPRSKPKIVVIMGPTGSGKSRLAIDLASRFPVEVINADSMQVYGGLDVLTNKVPLPEQKGVPHHLLGTISPTVEFNAKDFRDVAIPLIEDILSRNHLPVLVGGTNFYIQALVSPFLLDDSVEDMCNGCLSDTSAVSEPEYDLDVGKGDGSYSYECLKVLDPVAANRVHPNDRRKVEQYLDLIARSQILPSKLFQGKMAENWGRLDNSRYNCCFVCVDASLAVLDEYVGQRVDKMIDAGLLDEVYDIYTQNADYTRGLRQAVGVREFVDLLRAYFHEERREANDSVSASVIDSPNIRKENVRGILNSSDNQIKCLLEESINKLKANTRRLVRRQKRRINRLQTLFGWDIHRVDSTEFLCGGNSDEMWFKHVVEPAALLIRSFLSNNPILVTDVDDRLNTIAPKIIKRDLWTQYVCKACGDRVLRGGHEWEQHKQGRGHRKRVSRLKRCSVSRSPETSSLSSVGTNHGSTDKIT
ncbi:hypothetical protein Nepgr_000309 [Nepenthes gracilis]|uniref:tRNA dimethylallyltransferase 2 n=1 Tax=Nepenthes gracilis TaxID=150966 RepID=A0AAD3P1P0_NEPGR|nr:hypothetical protein Nepgr_000309 [Nepenthes gracilis]